ncbi:MAG: HPr(Ser) kinase/phosphatase [Clostridia bacterium]|nr:HPr(Ser) kinase/phosphatase [Clostridia bacterium]
MRTNYTVSLEKIAKELSLKTLYSPAPLSEIMISSNEVNRPGLQMAGYFEYFDACRIQIIGKSEESFIKRFTAEKAEDRIREFFSHKPAAVVVCRGLEFGETYLEIAKEFEIPVLKTEESTSGFSSALIALLNLNLAPRITQHGVLVEVYGEGILLMGDSGVGKSETAIELVKRGHRLIADDAVEIRRVSDKSLVGTAPDNIRHFIELRGIGIINASRIFGAGAVKLTEKIDLVINIEQWDVSKQYDRIGLEKQTTEILGLAVPSLTIPVKPGRNLAVIIEVAAMNNRQKKLGYNAAEDLLKKLGMTDDDSTESEVDPFF